MANLSTNGAVTGEVNMNYTNKTKDELIALIIEQNERIIDLELEKEQVDALIEDIKPIVEEIRGLNKFMRFVKIIKLTFALVDRITKYVKGRN